MDYSQFDIFFVNLDTSIGSKIQRVRPCLIVSPDEMNRHIATVIIAPITSKLHNYPTRVPCKVKGKQGQIVLDQIRTVDKKRLVNKINKLNKPTQTKVLNILREMFSE